MNSRNSRFSEFLCGLSNLPDGLTPLEDMALPSVFVERLGVREGDFAVSATPDALRQMGFALLGPALAGGLLWLRPAVEVEGLATADDLILCYCVENQSWHWRLGLEEEESELEVLYLVSMAWGISNDNRDF